MSEHSGVCWILDHYFYLKFSTENPRSICKIDIFTFNNAHKISGETHRLHDASSSRKVEK